MGETAIPVLWLCGPPGVGKTAVGRAIYARLAGSGVRTAYVDIDQLGICYPPPVSDPQRHHLKARNLGGGATTSGCATESWGWAHS